MKSAFECFQEAAKCEKLAERAPHEIERLYLLDGANEWRKRGEAAAKAGAAIVAAAIHKAPKSN